MIVSGFLFALGIFLFLIMLPILAALLDNFLPILLVLAVFGFGAFLAVYFVSNLDLSKAPEILPFSLLAGAILFWMVRMINKYEPKKK